MPKVSDEGGSSVSQLFIIVILDLVRSQNSRIWHRHTSLSAASRVSFNLVALAPNASVALGCHRSRSTRAPGWHTEMCSAQIAVLGLWAAGVAGAWGAVGSCAVPRLHAMIREGTGLLQLGDPVTLGRGLARVISLKRFFGRPWWPL